MRKPWLFPLLLSLSLATMPQLAVGQTIDELFQQGKVAIESRNYSQAESIYRQAIQLYPNNADAYSGLGFALYYQKKVDEAIANYRRAIQLDPNYAPTYNYLGIALYEQKKVDEALANFRRAIEIDPNDADGYTNLGNVLKDQKKLEEAVAYYRRAIQLDPNYAVPYNNLGNVLSDQGKLDEAVANFRHAIQLDPNFAFAYNNLGNALRDQKKVDEAVANYRRAIQLDPNYAAAYNNLGLTLSDQGKLEEAVANYRRAIQIDPNYAVAYFNLANALKQHKKIDEAIAAFRQAIQLDPNYAFAYNNLGIVFTEQKKFNEALAALRRAIQIDSNYALAYNNLGIALYYQKKYEEAIAAFRQALRLPEDTTATPASAHTLARSNLGATLVEQGKLEEAIEEYKKSIALDPNYVTAQNNLKEAERLLALRRNPPPPNIDDRQWLPSRRQQPLVDVYRSVVRIIAQFPTGPNLGPTFGAGWVVKREGKTVWIVTNRHVITDDYTRSPSEKIEVEFYSEPPSGQFPLRRTARIVQITKPDDPLDLAVLEVTGIPDDIKPLPTYSGIVSNTTPVRVIGHPLNGRPWSQVPGEISNVSPNESTLQIDANLAQGNSGGPVIDLENRIVVGVMVQITNGNQFLDAADTTQAQPPSTGGFGFAYRIDVVMEKLRSWGILK